MLVTKIENNIIIVIDDDTLERLNAGDPLDLPLASVGADSDLTVVVGRATNEAIKNAKNSKGLMEYMYRGYKVKPEDHFKPHKVNIGAKEKND